LLHDQWVTEEIREESNENTTYQNLWDTSKAVLWGKFIAMNAYIRNIKRPKINDLILHHKVLEKQGQANPKPAGKRK
jgi:hypothetical protein